MRLSMAEINFMIFEFSKMGCGHGEKVEYSRQLFNFSTRRAALSLSLLILYILHSMAAQIPFFHIISDHFAFEIIMCTRYIQFCKFFRHAKILISTALCCALELNIIYVELYAF